jgi:hypothetical protein
MSPNHLLCFDFQNLWEVKAWSLIVCSFVISPNHLLCFDGGECESIGDLFHHLMEEKINPIREEQKCMQNYNVGWVGGHMN